MTIERIKGFLIFILIRSIMCRPEDPSWKIYNKMPKQSRKSGQINRGNEEC